MNAADRKLLILVLVPMVLMVVGGSLVGVYWQHIVVRYYVWRSESEDVLLLKLADIEKQAPGAPAIDTFYERLLRRCFRSDDYGKMYGEWIVGVFQNGDEESIRLVEFAAQADGLRSFLCTVTALAGDGFDRQTLFPNDRVLAPSLYIVSLLPKSPTVVWQIGAEYEMANVWTHCKTHGRVVSGRSAEVWIGDKKLDTAGAPYVVLFQSDGKVYDIRRVADVRKKP
jgi:hypothetical protein